MHLDGELFEVARRGKVTQDGDEMRVKEKGMPFHGDSSKFGDLLVKVHVDFSQLRKLSPEEYESKGGIEGRV